MQIIVQYKQLENDLTWILVNDKTVNPVPVDSLIGTHLRGALELALVSSQPYGGALLANKQPFPIINGKKLTYVGLDFKFLLSQSAIELMRCFEVDFKLCDQAPSAPAVTMLNVIDLSAQFEWYRNGQFQIDNNQGSWVDTPFAVGVPLANTWNAVSYRGSADYANRRFSFLSMRYNGTQYDIPTTMQNLPMLNTNWGQVAAVQNQLDNNAVAGAFSSDLSGVEMTFSDQPF